MREKRQREGERERGRKRERERARESVCVKETDRQTHRERERERERQRETERDRERDRDWERERGVAHSHIKEPKEDTKMTHRAENIESTHFFLARIIPQREFCIGKARKNPREFNGADRNSTCPLYDTGIVSFFFAGEEWSNQPSFKWVSKWCFANTCFKEMCVCERKVSARGCSKWKLIQWDQFLFFACNKPPKPQRYKRKRFSGVEPNCLMSCALLQWASKALSKGESLWNEKETWSCAGQSIARALAPRLVMFLFSHKLQNDHNDQQGHNWVYRTSKIMYWVYRTSKIMYSLQLFQRGISLKTLSQELDTFVTDCVVAQTVIWSL